MQHMNADWGNDNINSTPSAYRTSSSVNLQDVKRQLEKQLISVKSALNRRSASAIVPSVVRALESFGHNMPEIMQAAQQNGTSTALKAQFKQLASALHQLIEIHEPNQAKTCKQIIAIIYAHHPPAQAHAPEHAACLKTLELAWHPGAIVGLWEQYVEGTPHASSLITFCSTCMRDLKVLLLDAAQRKQECTQLSNALWQFEQQL